jgi:hypothetical protein
MPYHKETTPVSELSFFTRQSQFSTPGRFSHIYDDLPVDVRGLCRVVQGLVIHYRSSSLEHAQVPRRRLAEVNTRYVDKILQRLIEMDARPLASPRPTSRRIIGCCRDFALLFTSMARHRGIPARLRVGFANYFAGFPTTFWVDHTVAEVWSPKDRRWRLVDPEQSPALIRTNRIGFDVTDIPRDSFMVGGRAWLLCRAGKVADTEFGVDPGREPRGLWFVRSRLLLDLAALNRKEVLLWDSWPAISPAPHIGSRGAAELDYIATNLTKSPPSIKLAHTAYRSRRWRVPSVVWCYSPIGRPRKERLRPDR